MKNKNKNSHWLTQPKRPSTNQSDYSMTSWVMTSAPETKHPSRSSLCSFLSNEFKDTERKHSVLASVRLGLRPEAHYHGALPHIITSVKMWPDSYNCTFVFVVFDTCCIFRWIGFAFQDWSSSTLHTALWSTAYWIHQYNVFVSNSLHLYRFYLIDILYFWLKNKKIVARDISVSLI